MEEQIVRHTHENKDSRPDSIEIGTAGKGGVVKVYINLLTMDESEIRAIINKALSARTYIQGGVT